MTDTYSPDRHSIVTFLSNLAGSFDKGSERDLVYTLVTQIQRGDDLIPAKPKTTISDLLALHDLDLGALAHKVGVTGEGITTAQVDGLCEQVDRAPVGHDFVYSVAYEMPGGWLEDLRTLSALGAKVRAALSAPTSKVAAPRVLQSADDAPCGSLWQVIGDPQRLVMRLPDGRGWGMALNPGPRFTDGWVWDSFAHLDFPARLIADVLTEAECRHLSGLSAADALAWCEQREAARRA